MLTNFKNFWLFCRTFGIHNKEKMLFLVLGGFAMSLLELLGLSALFPLMMLIIQPEAAQNSGLIRKIGEVTGAQNGEQIAMILGFSIACLFVVKNLSQALYWRAEFRILAKWRIWIITRLYHIYMHSDYEIFMKRNSSHMMNILTGTVPMVVTNFVHPMLNLINYGLTGLMILLYIVSVNWMMCAVVFIAGVALMKGYTMGVRNRTRRLGEETQEAAQKQIRQLQQSFVGYKETHGHLKEDFFARQFLSAAKDYAEKEEGLFFWRGLPPVIVEVAMMILLIVIFEVVIYTGGDVRVASAQLGVMVLATMRMIPVINRSITSIVSINSAQVPLRQLMDEAEIFRLGDQNPAARDESAVAPLAFADRLEMKGLSYAYPEGKSPALSDIDFSLRPGEFIGITGPSGSGKSTLVNILLGFLTRFSGKFTVDGHAITPENIRSLRLITGLVDQQIFMMDVSIAENIAFGVEKEKIDRDRVRGALVKAQLWDYVETLPGGMDTVIGENGKLLSGGQRQRIAIARAFYRDLKILILDEASASLDVETEHRLFTFLDTLKSEIAVIMIAHRLSTLKSCDRIYFFEKGRIADSGTFEDLYRANAKFSEYVRFSQIDVGTQAK